MDYRGVIIEESLENAEALKKVKLLWTNVEGVTDSHDTPWLKKWTLHHVLVPEEEAEAAAKILSESLDKERPWYADFKNESTHFVVFRDKVFKINRESKEEYKEAVRYGLSLGIPAHQLDFSPDIRDWKR
ncbi:hypothetical protein HYV91_01875 [Candidatus Wolfebacteria bacterium]|nr:hypothetical protein [Candidatus Wolfebacteria bacterium]